MKISISIDEALHHNALKETGFWGRRAAGCLFLAKNTNRLLIAHRSDKVLEPNTYGTWGGALDGTETPLQGVMREVQEETEFYGDVDYVKLSVFKHDSGFEYHNFLAVVDQEFEPQLNWETQGFKWVLLGHWPNPLHPGLYTLLNQSSNIDIMRKHMVRV